MYHPPLSCLGAHDFPSKAILIVILFVIFQLLIQWVRQETGMLSGRDVIVEVDEAKVDRRKCNRGRVIGRQ